MNIINWHKLLEVQLFKVLYINKRFGAIDSEGSQIINKGRQNKQHQNNI